MLEIDIRSKFYRTAAGHQIEALGALGFSVAAGEFVCLTGPSGCGKTTILRLILGLDADFDGTIARPLGQMAAVFQEPRLLPWRTVEQNIRLALPPERAETDLAALLAELGLDGAADLYSGELSLGMARRVALARAFAVEPALLTLDEPFASLDDATAGRLRKLLLRIWQAKRTAALMVTHDLREAAELADRVIVLSGRPGTVIAEHRIELPRENRDAAALDRIVGQIRQLGAG